MLLGEVITLKNVNCLGNGFDHGLIVYYGEQGWRTTNPVLLFPDGNGSIRSLQNPKKRFTL